VKVLLIRPPVVLTVARRFHSFLHLEPLDLEIVAGGVAPPHEPAILDLALSRRPAQDLAGRLRSDPPDLVGFTGYSNQAHTVRDLARVVRRECPAARVLVGGVHATVAPADFCVPGVVDLVVRGEGSTAIRRILALPPGHAVSGDPALLFTASPEFARLAAGPPPPLPEFADVARPRRDLVDRSAYFCIWSGEPGSRLPRLFPPVASVRTSVGCPFRCSFCVVHHLARGRYIARTPEDVVDELAGLDEDHVYFVDDEMFVQPARAARIAQLLIERGIRKRYVSWARSDTIRRHPEVFERWRQAGLDVVYVGLESMTESHLEGFHKGAHADDNREAVAILRRLGIGLHAAFIVHPDFTREDFLRTREAIDLVCPAEVSFTVLSPSPGTEFWEETKARFISPDPYRFYDCMHTLLPTRLPLPEFYRYFSLLYLFAFRKNPWRINRVRAPWRDIARLLVQGALCGHALRTIHRDYPGTAVSATPS
jgi:radical SAM superfamily enzyme YgiQ (UPF0313 family)